MHSRRKIIIIFIAVIVLCGIGYYAKDFYITKPKKAVINESKTNNIDITKNNAIIKISMDKIMSTDKIEDICGSYSNFTDDHLTVVNEGKELLLYNTDKTKKIVKKLPKDYTITPMKAYKNYIVFMETDIEKRNGDEPFDINNIYIYDTEKNTLTKVKGGCLGKRADGIYYNKDYVSNFTQLYNGKLFYSVYKPIDEYSCETAIFMYDIDNKQEKQIYRLSSKDKNEEVTSFDVDLEKGFLLYQDSKDSAERLQLINLKNEKRRILAKTRGIFELSLKYPYVIFNLKNDIHVYNIEKDDDDICIKCEYAPSSLEFVDNKLIFFTKKSYCYSMKTKKVYEIPGADKGIKTNKKNIYYYKNDKFKYIKLADIE